MRTSVKITRIGNDLGLVLPTEMLSLLGSVEGDSVTLVATADELNLQPVDGELCEQLALGREFAQQYGEALGRLVGQ